MHIYDDIPTLDQYLEHTFPKVYYEAGHDVWLFQLLKRIKSKSKIRKIEFNLTFDYLKSIWTPICPVFNTPFIITDGGTNPNTPSIDRIVPARGYTIGNVAFISLRANKIKGNRTAAEISLQADKLENNGTAACTAARSTAAELRAIVDWIAL
jgi:hypothetical protein